ncbi:MAG: hypothetical protein KC486_17970 [Myxococcales bacterium]|nr:hypothetical protein [Myxococcales bacterium]
MRTTSILSAITCVALLTACGDDAVGTASDTDSTSSTTGTTDDTTTTTSAGTSTTTTSGGTDSDSDSTTTTTTTGETTAVETTGTTTTTTGPDCVDPEVECGGVCVNPQNDPLNCGGCGLPCDDGLLCSMGECVPDCMGETPDLCDGICTDVQADPMNCGGCGMACGADEACEAGACVPLCAEGELYCDMVCVDPQIDPMNCGDCGVACNADEACEAGACVPLCGEGELYCAEECIDPQTDELHCGGCDMPCAADQVCLGGGCVTPKILVIGASGIVSKLQSSGYTVTSVGWAQAVANLDVNEYPVAFVGRYATNWANITDPIKTALDDYNKAGGAIVTEWDGVSLFLSGFHNTYRYPNGAQSMSWFKGEIGAGHNRGNNTPITQTLPNDALFANVNNPFMAGGATEFFFTFYNTDDAELELMATFPGNGTANFPNGDLATIYRGRRCGANVILASWDYQDDGNNAGFGDLIPNFVTAALAPPSGNVNDVCP